MSKQFLLFVNAGLERELHISDLIPKYSDFYNLSFRPKEKKTNLHLTNIINVHKTNVIVKNW